MHTTSRVIRSLCWVSPLLVAAFLVMSLAQPAAADDDPPGRVARLNYMRGSVSFEPAGESEWGSAVVNRPMTTGDRLWVDNGARAEMNLGSATIRLDAVTGLSLLNLDDHTTQIQLSEGTLNIRVRRLDRDEEFEVDTPTQAFSILQPGDYRVQANENGDSTLVTVRAGSGEVTGGGRDYSVGAGLSGEFTGTDSLHADIFRAGDYDEFDRWGQDRDRRDEQSPSARYVSRDVVGYEDLDDNGSWRQDPEYGDVWVPKVYAGWAPYRDGHWAWISPWGWTWVDDAPWGYAPFHYGRWVYARDNWCWVPGPREVRPVYAPALVAFVGGPSFGLSISVGGRPGGGNVGWFPLGPREVYVPSYNVSREYVTRVNVSNTTVNNTTVINVYNNQVTNDERGRNRGFDNGNNRNNSEIKYMNRTAPGGVTVVSQNTFAGAQPVGKAVIAVNPRDIASAPVGRRAEVAPTRNSVYGNSAPTGNRVAQPSAAVANRTVVAKTPPPPPPVSFERQQQRLAAQPGTPLAKSEMQGLRPTNAPTVQPQVRQAPPGRPATADSVDRPANMPPSRGPASVGANPPANTVPAGRNDRPNGPNFGRPSNAQPPNPPPAKVGGNPPPNNVPPARNDRPNDMNRTPPPNVQPPPPAKVGGNPPPNNVPPARNDRPNDMNRGQPPSTKPLPPPTPTKPVNPPAKQPPPAHADNKDEKKPKDQDKESPQH